MAKQPDLEPITLPPAFRVCRTTVDGAKKWRVQVQVDVVGNTEILKFEKEPTLDEIKASCSGLLTNQATAKAQAEADAEAKVALDEKIVLIKDMPLADLKTKLTAVAVVVK